MQLDMYIHLDQISLNMRECLVQDVLPPSILCLPTLCNGPDRSSIRLKAKSHHRRKQRQSTPSGHTELGLSTADALFQARGGTISHCAEGSIKFDFPLLDLSFMFLTCVCCGTSVRCNHFIFVAKRAWSVKQEL